MNKRQFAVRVAARTERDSAPLDLVTDASLLPTEELGAELSGGGLERPGVWIDDAIRRWTAMGPPLQQM